jgi:hypothetical protein
MCVRVINQTCNQNIKWKKKNTDILATKFKIFKQRETPLRGSQTQEIYYSEEIASYKTVVLTNPITVVVS